MDFETDTAVGHQRRGERTLSNTSELSSQCSKFPLMASDSGHYTCSSNNSEYQESDTESYHLRAVSVSDEALQLALLEAGKLRSELERLSKSEQWYKQELRQQKSTRLEDLERIYTQERKFMQENQRLQKECVRLYDKCSVLERDLEKYQQDSHVGRVHPARQIDTDESERQFEVKQQTALIKDQQLLIDILRKQKKSLLDDLRSLSEDKDEKVMEMQRLIVDLGFDNKQITKKCTDLSKERSFLENVVKQKDSNLSAALDDKLNLQKTLAALRDQLKVQENLVRLKENEIEHMQINFKNTMQSEQDLDEVHRISIDYHEEIINKSLEIKTLKNQLSAVQHEIENLQELQAQNDHQQRLIEQLHYSLDACKLELKENKQSGIMKSTQIADLRKETELLVQDKVKSYEKQQRQQMEITQACQELKSTKEQYALVQQQYKDTQYKLELVEIERGKLQFEKDNGQQEICHLRRKLTEYLQQTSVLSERMQRAESDLAKAVRENTKLKHHLREVQHELNNAMRKTSVTNITESEDQFRKDFVELSKQCERLQCNLDVHNSISKEKSALLPSSEDFDFHSSPSSTDGDLSAMFVRLQENSDIFRCLLNNRENTVYAVSSAQQPNDDMEELVNENQILNITIKHVENEAFTLQLMQDLDNMTHKSAITQDLLTNQKQKVKELQQKLLSNDARLYKIERQMQITQSEDNTQELQRENLELKACLEGEQIRTTQLNAQLSQVSEQATQLKEKLEQSGSKQTPLFHKDVQCDIESPVEVEKLKEQLLELQEKERQLDEKELQRKDERIQLLHQLSDIHNSKILYIQNSQKDWQDMLQSLKAVQTKEDETQQELELKRRELEELNHVFGKQNEELRKLEELTALLETKRRQEKVKLEETFQQKIGEMKQELQKCREEVKQQESLNLELQNRNKQIQQTYNDRAEYEKEIRSLKAKLEQSLSDKYDLVEHIGELEDELKNIKSHHRQAFIMPQLTTSHQTDMEESCTQLVEIKSKVSEDHLRILTKVLESEYDRKMQRYDQHIHSLLSNVKALKNSLRLNEKKTALLDGEQSRSIEELKDLQRTKRKLEDIRYKYEQSQNTIEDLKETLALERKKFNSSEVGKSAPNQITTYEVSNLIDDYKKLIQQSAAVTKRPTTCTVLELIQRSNQCVPNLHKIESNLVDLRSDLQSLLSSYAQKMPGSALTNAATLTVPPSLMDELRAASESY